MGSHLSLLSNDIDNDPALIDGKIVDDHTIEWSAALQPNFSVVFNSGFNNSRNILYILLEFADKNTTTNTNTNTNMTRIKFSVPITGLNIKESKKNNLTALTVTLKTKQSNTTFSKVTGNKYYENVVSHTIQSLVADTGTEISVTLVPGEKKYSREYVVTLSGLVTTSIVLTGLSFYSLYNLFL